MFLHMCKSSSVVDSHPHEKVSKNVITDMSPRVCKSSDGKLFVVDSHPHKKKVSKNIYDSLPIEGDDTPNTNTTTGIIPLKGVTAVDSTAKKIPEDVMIDTYAVDSTAKRMSENATIDMYASFHMDDWGYDEEEAYELAQREYEDDLAWSSAIRNVKGW